MPYIINRAIHDADAHILETPEMLDQSLAILESIQNIGNNEVVSLSGFVLIFIPLGAFFLHHASAQD
jgi:hypothetical protein